MKKILLFLLTLISLKGFTQANYQFYKATIGAGLYFKAIPASASTLDSAVYVDRTTGEFQVRKVPADGISGSGTSGRVAYWDGASSLTSSSNYTFDGNTLGVSAGSSATGADIGSSSGYGANIHSTSGPGAQISSSSNTGLIVVSTTGVPAEIQTEPPSTNTTVPMISCYRKTSGTAAENIAGSYRMYNENGSGSDILSNEIVSKLTTVTGSAEVSQFEIWGVNAGTFAKKASIAGSGQWAWDTYGAGTHTVTPATTPVVSSAGIVGERVAPKIYTALISQAGTSDPTVTVLGTNEIGTIVWTRSTTGVYVGTLSSAFAANKTWVASSVSDEGLAIAVVRFQRTNDNVVTLYTSDNTFTAADVFTNISIRIEVYP